MGARIVVPILASDGVGWTRSRKEEMTFAKDAKTGKVEEPARILTATSRP
jgi:hypothetical protein